MEENHTHTGDTYSVDGVNQVGQIVCIECHPKDLKGMNECFCKCHTAGKRLCLKCKPFHVTAGQ